MAVQTISTSVRAAVFEQASKNQHIETFLKLEFESIGNYGHQNNRK